MEKNVRQTTRDNSRSTARAHDSSLRGRNDVSRGRGDTQRPREDNERRRTTEDPQKNSANIMNILYSVCTNKKNIDMLVETIYEDVKLGEKHRPKCIDMIVQNMKQNIRKLSRAPKNKEELREMVYYLNKICVDDIIRYIVAKNPGLHIARRRQPAKEQIKRDLDVYGERDCHVQKRPHANTVKNYDENEGEPSAINMQINDTGFSGADSHSNIYASPWENYSITNEPPKTISPPQNTTPVRTAENIPFNNPHTKRNPDDFDHRYQMLTSERRVDMERTRPEEIDFSLDGGGNKARQERERRNASNQNESMMGTPISSNSTGLAPINDDPYASLLGDGAPGGLVAPVSNDNFGAYSNFGEGSQFDVQDHLTPQSSTSNIQNQNPSYSDNQQSAKSAQLQSDYEMHLAKRREIDVLTNQDGGNGRGQTNNSVQQSMYEQQPMFQQQQQPSYQQQQPMYQQQPMQQQPMYQSIHQPMYQ